MPGVNGSAAYTLEITMTSAAITDTRAIAHYMQANAQRGLLWGIGISVLIHMAVLTVQVGGDSFGWRAPTSDAQQDTSTRMKARLVPRETTVAPMPETAPRLSEQRPSDAPKTTTMTVTASSPIPRAEELDPPTPRVEQPAALRVGLHVMRNRAGVGDSGGVHSYFKSVCGRAICHPAWC